MRSATAPLRAAIDRYHQLPPDMSLAQVKLAEARRQLVRLRPRISSKTPSAVLCQRATRASQSQISGQNLCSDQGHSQTGIVTVNLTLTHRSGLAI